MSLHLGFSVRCVTFVLCVLLPFWMAQWTEYHAHVLPTSIAGLIGVTEAQVLAMGMAFLNMFSTDIWNYNLGVGTMPHWWCGRDTCPVSLNDLFVVTQLVCAVLGVAQCLGSVLIKAENKGLAMRQCLPAF